MSEKKEISSKSASAHQVIDRRSGAPVPEPVLGDRVLRLAYSRLLRHFFQVVLFGHDLISRLMGLYCDSRRSRHKIDKTIKNLNIDMQDFVVPADGFSSFNEFFYRKLRRGVRPCDRAPEVLVSPADARLLAFADITQMNDFPVKDKVFTLAGLLQDAAAAEEISRPAIVILRLCPADYHRFHFPADGRKVKSWPVSGRLNSVNPMVLALGFDVFSENRREVTMLELDRFGPAAFVEVGAFGVAGIVQTHEQENFDKMEEKGYFRFGASTIVLALCGDRLTIDADLLQNTASGRETLVRCGEPLGRRTVETLGN